MDNQDLLYEIIKKTHENRPDLVSEGVMDCDIENKEYWKVIFSPEFAKAYWGENIPIRELGKGEEIVGYDIPKGNSKKYWEICQHKMLDEIQAGRNPLKYLSQFI